MGSGFIPFFSEGYYPLTLVFFVHIECSISTISYHALYKKLGVQKSPPVQSRDLPADFSRSALYDHSSTVFDNGLNWEKWFEKHVMNMASDLCI